MGITVEQSDVMNAIRLEGEVNINSATELKARLVQAIASGKELRLELKGAPELQERQPIHARHLNVKSDVFRSLFGVP
jgi:hypothetical protein